MDLINGNTIQVSASILRLGGPNQWAIDEGRYAWLQVPTGENPDDCVLSQQSGTLVVDQALKTARLAAVQDATTRQNNIATLKARIQDLDALSDLTAAQLKEAVQKILRILLLKGGI